VINTFPDHQELYWNAIGDEWQVSIAAASATVAGPAKIQKATCFEGTQGSTTPASTGSVPTARPPLRPPTCLRTPA